MNKWQRQHSAAIFIGFLSNLKELIFTIIAVLILGSQMGGGLFYTIFFTVILVGSIASGIIKWLTFKYRLVENELQIKQGLIFKKSRYIRKERIQSIDINAKLLQRLFHLVELRIETAGGGAEPEFRIVALRRSEATIIKEELLKHDSDETIENYQEEDELVEYGYTVKEEEVQPTKKWVLSKQRLLIAAITSSGIGIAAAFVAAITSQIQQFIPAAMYERFIGWLLHSSLLLIGFWLVIILFLGWLISLVSTLLKYGMFKVEKSDDEIHISRGVLEQRQLTLSAKRITAIRIVQNLIRQPFGYVSVYVESAGGGRQDEDLSTILIPICKRSEVTEILQEFLPDYAVEHQYQPLPKQSVRRYIIRLIIPAMIIAGLLVYFFQWGWMTLVIPVLAALYGYWQYVSAGITREQNLLFLKSRAISLTEVIIPRKRIQALKSTQSLFQRFDDLYSIHASIMSSILGKTFTLRHVSKQQMGDQFIWYSYEEQEENRVD